MSYTLYQGTRIGQALKEALEELEVNRIFKIFLIKRMKLHIFVSDIISIWKVLVFQQQQVCGKGATGEVLAHV